MSKKVCNKCGIEKENTPEYFGFTPAGNLRSECKECQNKRCQINKKVNVTCEKCGEVYIVNKYRKTNLCHECVIKIREEDKKSKEEIKQLAKNLSKELNKINKYQQKIINKQEKIKERTKECLTCGKAFIGKSVLSSYCSSKCANRSENRKKELRKGKRADLIKYNGKIDNDISLERLIQRDNNTCYLCGNTCDSSDYTVTDEGYYITGNCYPSIDHVIAIANGGTHTWDNVLLAHRICNSVKSDKVII